MLGYEFLNFDILSAVIFVIVMIIVLYVNRSKLGMQKLIAIGKIPILYLLLFRTQIGLKLMDKISTKYREAVRLFGYCSIGIGFFGMILVSLMMILSILLLIFKPEIENGAALILPFTNIPGLGYLSFWHFILSLFFIAVIHEFAHGVMARAYNIKVQSSGTGVFGLIVPLFPLAFVEPDEKEIAEQPDYVQYSVFAAGPVINIIVGLMLYLLFIFAVSPIGAAMIEEQGFVFETLNESYPASVAGLGTDESMIINSLNDRDVVNYQEFIKGMSCIRPGENITIGTASAEYSFVTTISPTDEDQGFIGIRPIENKIDLEPKYEALSTPYFWFEGLLKWLYRLNLLVGIFNLLPIMIVDGGRMFQIAVKKLVPNKDIGNKMIGYIAFMFIAIILILLLKTYGTRFLGLFGF